MNMNNYSIKVLHFELSDKIGGIETFIKNCYKEILEHDKYNNIKFDLVTSAEKGAFEDWFIDNGCKVYHIGSVRCVWGYIKKIKSIVCDNTYEVIHFHKNSLANIIPILIAKKYSESKIIIHSHNTSSNFGWMTNLLHHINKKIFNNISDFKLACSLVAKDWMFKKNDIVEILVNGIDLSEFKYDYNIKWKTREKYNFDSDDRIFLHIGRFCEQKNHKYLIKIFEAIQKKGKKSMLVLVGKGSKYDYIKNFVIEKKIQDKVIFLGEIQNVNEILCLSDVFIFPSLYEGLPITLIEAQASNIPCVVASNISEEVIINENVYSLEVSDNKIEEWANTCIKLLNLKRNNEISKEILNSKFNIHYTVKNLVKIYERIVSLNTV